MFKLCKGAKYPVNRYKPHYLSYSTFDYQYFSNQFIKYVFFLLLKNGFWTKDVHFYTFKGYWSRENATANEIGINALFLSWVLLPKNKQALSYLLLPLTTIIIVIAVSYLITRLNDLIVNIFYEIIWKLIKNDLILHFSFYMPLLINKIFPLSTKGFFVTQRYIVCELKNEKKWMHNRAKW